MNQLQQLAFDTYKGTLAVNNYSTKQASDVLRQAFLERLGLETFTAKEFRRLKTDIFEIIEETITPILNDRLEQQMGEFAEVRNVALGDTIVFDVEDPKLFDVANIARGTHNLRKQRIDNGKLPVEMERLGVAIYEELERYLSGRIDWAKLVDKVIRSFDREIALRVQNALFAGHSSVAADFIYSGSYDEDELLRILGNVEQMYGSAQIVGTKTALAKIKPNYGVGDADNTRVNALGHLGHFRGYNMVELVQTKASGTMNPNLSTTDLLILPASESKFVKILIEGESTVIENENPNGDGSKEYTFMQNVAVAVTLAKYYGIVRFS